MFINVLVRTIHCCDKIPEQNNLREGLFWLEEAWSRLPHDNQEAERIHAVLGGHSFLPPYSTQDQEANIQDKSSPLVDTEKVLNQFS